MRIIWQWIRVTFLPANYAKIGSSAEPVTNKLLLGAGQLLLELEEPNLSRVAGGNGVAHPATRFV
jgi:hypothetical protein